MLRPSRVAIDETPCNSAAEGRTGAAGQDRRGVGPYGGVRRATECALGVDDADTADLREREGNHVHDSHRGGSSLAHRLDVLIALVDVEAQHPAREGDERAEPDDDDDRGQAEGGAE